MEQFLIVWAKGKFFKRARKRRTVRSRTNETLRETSFRTDKMQLPFGCHVTVRTASRKPLNLVFLVLLLCRFEHLSLSKTRVKKFLTNCSASTILYIYMIIKFTYIYNRKITVKSLSSFRDIFIFTPLKCFSNYHFQTRLSLYNSR